jgi:hypothetical protein
VLCFSALSPAASSCISPPVGCSLLIPFPIPAACTAAERRLWARKRADDSVPDSASVGIIIICCGRTAHRIVQAKLGTLLREAGTQGFQSRESLAVALSLSPPPHHVGSETAA